MVRLTRKNDYFDYTTRQIRKRTDIGENDEKERTPSATREFKCLFIKEFILHFQKKDSWSSTPQPEEKMSTVDHVSYRE
jgi:hypothetical protein